MKDPYVIRYIHNCLDKGREFDSKIKREVKTKGKTKVMCITCPKCNDTIYSRTRHDMHSCKCGSVFIDGGFEYQRIGCNPKIKIEDIKYSKHILSVSKENLFHDWNTGANKHGRITEDK